VRAYTHVCAYVMHARACFSSPCECAQAYAWFSSASVIGLYISSQLFHIFRHISFEIRRIQTLESLTQKVYIHTKDFCNVHT
jgi:hypothetical protein